MAEGDDSAPPTLPATPSAIIARTVADLVARVEIIEQGRSLPPSAPGLATPLPVAGVTSSPPPPRPSMAARAAKTTGKLGQWVLIAVGAMTVLAQLAALKYPEQVGPVRAVLESLLAALGGPQ